MKVKVFVEISQEEMNKFRQCCPDDWSDADVANEFIGRDYDRYMQDIEVKII